MSSWGGRPGDDAGLSEARYVVAKMLSRSDSCGRSRVDDDAGQNCSGARGAVLERPVWLRVLGAAEGEARGYGWTPAASGA